MSTAVPSGNDPEHPRAHPLGDPLDRASLPGGVPALEHDADLGPGLLDPLLHRHQLTMQDPHLPLILLALHLRGLAGSALLPHCCRRRLALGVVLLLLVALLLGHVAYLRYVVT
jgi:hypothetical protein